MTGSCSIDLSLKNIWKSWFDFKKGKKKTAELNIFEYYLEANIFKLFQELNNRSYQYGEYRKFVVADNKKREISVAPIRDRVVHRLIYNYLVEIYNETFIYDVWSCRKDKGLFACIERTQKFLHSYPNSFVWRSDVKKFFDNIDHEILLKILFFKIKDEKTIWLLKEIIQSFEKEKGVGIPIGNLTSQIFSNIYLNEFDRYIVHNLKPKRYIRYGDDFLVIENDFDKLEKIKIQATQFLNNQLKLQVHDKNNIIVRPKHGIKFLGMILYPNGRKLNKRSLHRISSRLTQKNAGSYFGMVRKHGNFKLKKEFQWRMNEVILV
ncbi:MAG: RNA-directed DNA polymerase [Candidatus Peregrinibacteria bacterium GW2011_GWF2_33_10]|nr:MAG: RNA-directed DNA polymerase [Candidatus Peregrinibacteria bacterium GW2011_GWF2_33_10]OGJ44994.1 MAG: hypothetical protein A2263_02935 [Candidatus Peregrinibacteria bacterium RIFOXYA2_FULL_33_21]